MKLAVYDFDGTYMKNEILRKVYKFWKIKKVNPKMYRKIWYRILFRNLLYRFRLFGWTKAKFRVNAMSLTADLFRSVEREMLDKFLDDLYVFLQPFVNKEVKEQFLKDKEGGYHTILLSGNFNIILKPFLKEGFHDVIGSNVLKDNKVVPSDEVEIIIHKLKAKKILEKYPLADYENSKAYADSYYDLPILELVGHPVAVNPDDGLRKLSCENKYTIIDTKI